MDIQQVYTREDVQSFMDSGTYKIVTRSGDYKDRESMLTLEDHKYYYTLHKTKNDNYEVMLVIAKSMEHIDLKSYEHDSIKSDRVGNELADVLNIKPNTDGKFNTTRGPKTAVGLFTVITDIIISNNR